VDKYFLPYILNSDYVAYRDRKCLHHDILHNYV
jgi:hypothetical protein